MPKKAMELLTESMFYVLMAFMRGDKCGIEVVEFVDQRTKNRLQMGPATLYTILSKFEKETYIREINLQGRKRTYTITEKGRAAYQIELARLRQCVQDAEEAEL